MIISVHQWQKLYWKGITMLKEEIKNIKSGKSDLMKFGITVGIVLGMFGGLLFWKHKDYYHYFLIISFILILLGISLPSLLKPLQKAWMTIAVVIGWFMTRVILSILFYLVVTPIRILSRLFGNSFLDIKFNKDKSQKSYWVLKEKLQSEKNNYERQF